MSGEIDNSEYPQAPEDQTLDEMITKEESAFNKLPASEYKTMGQRFAKALRLSLEQRKEFRSMLEEKMLGSSYEETSVEMDEKLKALLRGESA